MCVFVGAYWRKTGFRLWLSLSHLKCKRLCVRAQPKRMHFIFISFFSINSASRTMSMVSMVMLSSDASHHTHKPYFISVAQWYKYAPSNCYRMECVYIFYLPIWSVCVCVIFNIATAYKNSCIPINVAIASIILDIQIIGTRQFTGIHRDWFLIGLLFATHKHRSDHYWSGAQANVLLKPIHKRIEAAQIGQVLEFADGTK